MAVVNNKGNDREKVTYKWGNTGPNYWQREDKTALQSCMRKSDKGNYELILKIQNLDDEGKFIKNEDGTFDNGYFNFTSTEIARVRYQLEQMFPTNDINAGVIGGIIVNHISAQSNNGSQFEIVSEEDGVYMYISYVQSGEVVNEYRHLLSNDQNLLFYDENGEEAKDVINMDVISIKELFSSAYALVSGLIDSVFEANGFGINGRSESKTGGKITGGLNRKVRSTLGSKRVADISEDDDSDEVEAPARKTVKKTVSSNLTKASNMKALLDDDDEEDE